MVDRLTLTVNSRLARWLLFHHSQEQSLEGNKVWRKPAIYSFNEWVRQVWLQSWPEQYALTELQSRNLWQKIIQEDLATPELSLLHIEGAASHAFQAYQLIREYHLPEDSDQFNNYTEETRTFHRWKTRYQKYLQTWHALDPAELLSALTERMKQGHIPVPSEICFYGFDDITPQLQAFLNLLKTKNSQIEFKPLEPSSELSNALQKMLSKEQASLQKYEDALEEVRQCARWIRSIYKKGQTIGVVVPEMESYRDMIEREFKAELAPASVYPWNDKDLPFNISLGSPLSHQPMIHIALLLLSQKSQRIPLVTFSTLITSPFLNCPETEKAHRRKLDWRLRTNKITHVFLPTALTPLDKEKYPALNSALKGLEDWINDSSSRLPSEWARGISKFLNQAAWPTSRKTLSSIQYQALNSWNECLDNLSSLDRILQKIDRAQAISHLTYIARETPFQPQTHEEPVQVIGMLESAGMTFDNIWVMGCHSEVLPPYPSPNPFLPFLSLQKPFNLPHSTADRELVFTEQILLRLVHASPHIIFSYPAWQRETEMKPSPLLNSLDMAENPIQYPHSSRMQDHKGFAVPLEKTEEYFPVPITSRELTFLEGGTRILKNQAECPFRAFAIHRLSSQKKDFPELDIDESFNGSLIHKIMELFWKQTRTSDNLQILYASNKLSEEIDRCIEKAFKYYSLDIEAQKSFFSIEHERLAHLIHAWMKIERERNPFEILQTEHKQTLSLSDLSLTLKVDRIDRTRDGKIVLIDYKTGSISNLKQWFGERIEEPQLPLYFLSVDADSIVFANIRPGESRYRGLARETNIILPRENVIHKINTQLSKENQELETWDDLKEFWNKNLKRLAVEFMEGHLRVSPLHDGDTCRYCDQITLCRKTELLNPLNESEE